VNPELANQIIGGIRLVQGLTGETIQIGGTNYTCTASTLVTGVPEFVAGGVINKLAITVTILKADFPNVPVLDTLASFRTYNFRIFSCEDAGLHWQISLVQEGA
jgi:hypothetical protein